MNQEIQNYLLQIAKLPYRQQAVALAQLYAMFKDNPGVSKILQLKPLNALQKSKKQQKQLDWLQQKCVKIAIKLTYDGQYFAGLAKQTEASSMLTVENLLLEALYQVQLIPREFSDKALDFSRAGRTDSGVSGRSQIVSLYVRTNADAPTTFGDLLKASEAEKDGDLGSRAATARCPEKADLSFTSKNTFSYLEMINSHLPRHQMRATSFAFVPSRFDARFSAKGRKYIYLLPQIASIEAVQAAANLFVGSKDFRNVCYQTEDVRSYERTITQFNVSIFNEQFYRLDIEGTAFLYHQIRCMVTLIVLHITGKIQQDKITQLFDMNGPFRELNKRPEYQIAPGQLLIFNGVEYDDKWELVWNEHQKPSAIQAEINILGELMAKTVVTQQLAGNVDVKQWFLSSCTQFKPW